MGGGGFSMEPDNPLLDDHVLALARARMPAGRALPRLCLLPTASGDSEDLIGRFHAAFMGRAETSVLPLFEREEGDPADRLLAQDALYVGGGNTANLLAIWRLHGIDVALRAAWEAGVVLAGLSAGGLCWFESGTTDSFGVALAPLDGCLGFLQGSFCPHYDGEERRRPLFHDLVGSAVLPAGYAADDGAALVFEGTVLSEVVASLPTARVYRVERGPTGTAIETELPTRFLGEVQAGGGTQIRSSPTVS